MTVEADITALLKAICPRVAPDFMATIPERPYITYQQIGGEAAVFLDGSLPSKENGEFQIDVWSDTRGEAKALIKQVAAAICASTAFQASPLAGPRSDSDPDMKLYCSRQDFSVWSNT